ncbi:hypothetical protein FH972_003766 [Carpinus fangiana]|uniref:Uncharacterized protein n=1 Tax=Carpinus fangiana TaxID=176857 RepID=A0A5N6QJ04_9ROSI|nr:hypothetical protein FH972_003766 [Carpinus fangiana]
MALTTLSLRYSIVARQMIWFAVSMKWFFEGSENTEFPTSLNLSLGRYGLDTLDTFTQRDPWNYIVPDRQKAHRGRRNGVVHETIGELVVESATQLGRERNGSSAKTHDSMGPIEARAGNNRTRYPKPAPECQVFQRGFSPVASVQHCRFLGEEATGKGAVGVGVLVAARGVELKPASVVAVGAWRVGDEPARGVEAVVEGEGGGVAGEEGGSRDVGGSGAVGFTGGALAHLSLPHSGTGALFLVRFCREFSSSE